MLDLFSEHLETPFGPAAGPQTQLSQNLIAAYYAGCRFFELKTVQTLDGEDLPVSKPCILAETSAITSSGRRNFAYRKRLTSMSRRGMPSSSSAGSSIWAVPTDLCLT
jgi:hypothetical protein